MQQNYHFCLFVKICVTQRWGKTDDVQDIVCTNTNAFEGVLLKNSPKNIEKAAGESLCENLQYWGLCFE